MSGLGSSAASSQPIGDPSASRPAQSQPAQSQLGQSQLGQSWTAPAATGDPNAGAEQAHQPHLGPDLQALIGQQLRAVYHEVLNEPVPDRFVRLLEELATKNASRA
jgi:hypothetical protein